MGFDPITAVFDLGSVILKRLIKDPEAQAAAEIELLRLKQTGELAQLTAETDLLKGQLVINAEEAKSSSLWVAGARPFFMWMCAAVFGYHFLVLPLILFIMAAQGIKVELPAFDMDAMMNVTLGILGLGGLRTYEKYKGVTK